MIPHVEEIKLVEWIIMVLVTLFVKKISIESFTHSSCVLNHPGFKHAVKDMFHLLFL